MIRTFTRISSPLALVALVAPALHAQCMPTWGARFGASNYDSYPDAIVSYNDGTDEVLTLSVYGVVGKLDPTTYSFVQSAMSAGVFQQQMYNTDPNSGGAYGSVYTMVTFDPDGSGPLPEELWIGGNFSYIYSFIFDTNTGNVSLDLSSGVPCRGLAKWDGSHWVDPGFYDAQVVFKLLSVPAGVSGASVPMLYIGGYPGSLISYETEAGFQIVGGEVTNTDFSNDILLTMAVHNNELHFGGRYTSQRMFKVQNNLIVGLDSSPGFPSLVCLASYDPDDAGPQPAELYAGNGLLHAIINYTGLGFAEPRLASWDGAAWTDFPVSLSAYCGDLNGGVNALVATDLGDGPKLYIGGNFATGAIPPVVGTNNVFSWNGTSISALGNGLAPWPDQCPTVWTMLPTTVNSERVLYISGDYISVENVTDYVMATWGGCADTPACVGDFNQSGAATVQDIFDFLAAWFSGDASADVNASGAVSVQDIFDFLAAWFVGC